MRASRIFLGCFAVLLASMPVAAQRERDTWTTASPNSFEVSGQVRLADSGQPAARVPIRLERFGGGIVDQIDSDSNGRFRFPNLQRGYYKVLIKAPGFHMLQQDADLQVVFRVFMVFDMVRDTSGTATLVDVIDANSPPEAREALARGRAALVKRNHAEAISHLEKAVFLYPKFYQAHLLLGTTFVDSRDWNKAEEAFQRALEIQPDSTAAVLSLGEVYWRQKRYDDAEKALLDGLKIEDKSWHGHFTLGRLYWERGNIAKAAPAIGRTLQLKPDFAEAHLLAGNILLRLEQRERALVEYQEYLRLEPKGEFAGPTRELVTKLSKVIVENKKSLN